MNKRTEYECAFWDIVLDNQLGDAWVPVAAEDPATEEAVGLRLGHSSYEAHDGASDGTYDELVQAVAHHYDLTQEQMFRALDICENNLKD